MTYLVTAPLVVVAGADGNLGYHYQGQPIDWLDAGDAQRLVADGMIEEVDDIEPPAVDDAPAEEGGDGDGAAERVTERPAPTDPKPEWIAYGIGAGLDAATVETMTKPQIAAAVDELIAAAADAQ